MSVETTVTVPRFMTPNKAAAATGIPVYIIRRKLRNGEVDYYKDGRTFYVNMTSLMGIICRGVSEYPPCTLWVGR